MADIRQVAVIGTGIMGAPMAARLAEAGFSVKAWNRSADKAAVLAEKGVQPTVTAAEAAAEAARFSHIDWATYALLAADPTLTV